MVDLERSYYYIWRTGDFRWQPFMLTFPEGQALLLEKGGHGGRINDAQGIQE